MIKDADTGKVHSQANRWNGHVAQDAEDQEIAAGLRLLSDADVLIGHNIIKFDIPAIRKLYPGFSTKAQVIDTLVMARMLWPDTKPEDAKRRKMPSSLVGRHSLEAWGYRLKMYKGEYGKEEGAFEHWTPEMQEYCEQDVEVTAALWRKIKAANPKEKPTRIEHEMARICANIETEGVTFDVEAASKLYAELAARRETVRFELVERFGSWWKPGAVQTGKRDLSPKRTKKHIEKGTSPVWRTEGAQHTPISRIEFNPGSRHHIAKVLIEAGWRPTEFTETGLPQVDEEILSELPYPEAEHIAEYMLVQKRLGQISEGDNGWLKKLTPDGKIHGGINPNGANTARATHSNPNLGQVPRVGTLYGKECRQLFGPPPGKWQVGTDMEGLELRCLAHYLARYDNGAYAETVVNGDKDLGTDIHTMNAKALGLDPHHVYTINGKTVKGRDLAKTFIYAYLYGGGDAKIGSIVGGSKKRGAELRAAFQSAFPAVALLQRDIRQTIKKRKGYISGLDGRSIRIRSEHSALNTLLQSAGAILCKAWIIRIDHCLSGMLGRAEADRRIMLWVHDELQIWAETEDEANQIGEISKKCAREVGVDDFKFRVALDAGYDIGKNWAETH